MIAFLVKYRLLHIILGAVLALAVLLIPKLILVAVLVLLAAFVMVPEIDLMTRTVEFPNKWVATGAMAFGGAGVVLLFFYFHRL